MKTLDISKKGIKFKNGEASEEASTLGLKVGEWPEVMELYFSHSISRIFTKLTDYLDHNEEFIGVVYEDSFSGLKLIVWND